jgi:hypothetical protein
MDGTSCMLWRKQAGAEKFWKLRCVRTVPSCTEISGEWSFCLTAELSQHSLTPVYILSCLQNLRLVNTSIFCAFDSPMLIAIVQGRPIFRNDPFKFRKNYTYKRNEDARLGGPISFVVRKILKCIQIFAYKNMFHTHKKLLSFVAAYQFSSCVLIVRCCEPILAFWSFKTNLLTQFVREKFGQTYTTCSGEQYSLKFSYGWIFRELSKQMCWLVHQPFRA